MVHRKLQLNHRDLLMKFLVRHGNSAVRLATPTDLGVCVEFELLDEFGCLTKLDSQIIEANINVGGVFLAERRKKIVGYASLNFLYASRTPLLSWWYVVPEHRGCGIGGLLLCAVDQYLTGLGFDRLLISACREREITRHRAHGLREMGYLDLGDNEHEIFFEKLLNNARGN